MTDSVITFTSGEVSIYYTARVPHLQQRRAAEWRSACPIHHGMNDSFAVEPDTGRWFCHSTCGRGGDILELEAALTGGDFPTRKAEVFQLVGRIEPEYRHHGTRTNGNLAGTAPPRPTKHTGTAGGWREIARYPYVDRDGSLLFEAVRYTKPNGDKAFKQCRPDGRGGVLWNLDGVERVPYRLPEVLQSDTIYLPEGERDVHTLEGWGLVASCNPGGCGNSTLYAGWTEYFRDRQIVILPDNDEPGRKHAAAVAETLLSVAASVRIVELPGLPAKGDITDWREAGGTIERFRELTEAAAPIDAAALSEVRLRWGATAQGPDLPALQARAGLLITRRMADIEAKPISWLWPGRIARGKVSIIAGNPGLGKSQITASIAASVTTGGCWPVDRQRAPLGGVIFLTAEDDAADTLRPRLEAAGANLGLVHVVDGVIAGYTASGAQHSRLFSLDEDLQALEARLAELGDVAAVVVDPLTAYLGNADSHKNAEVRALLAPLGELAARRNVAIIGVSHLNKGAGSQALMRVSGSLAFVAAARAAYLVAEDPKDKARRLFLPMKNNVGPDAQGLAYRIEPATVPSAGGPLSTSRVAWESEAVTITANEAMEIEATPADTSALSEASDWLREVLEEGPLAVTKVREMANDAGIANRTLRRASLALHVGKSKGSLRGGWLWSLPSKAANVAEEVQENNVDTFGGLGHLREGDEEIAEVEI